MLRNKVVYRKKQKVIFAVSVVLMTILIGRAGYLMLYRGEYYFAKAQQLHQRERYIKAARGIIYDATGKILADNRTVCTVSVIHNQIEDEEAVIELLVKSLDLSREKVEKKVKKYSAREIIETNVDKEVGDAIRCAALPGIKVDEDFRRYYPYGSLASKVLGFTGSDNQGIIGLEVKYDSYLKGRDGLILTLTDAKGVELNGAAEERLEPVAGDNLVLSLDINLQQYAQQAALKVMEEKSARQVSVLLMNPKNGEIKAMVNVPEFDLNQPFQLPEGTAEPENEEERQDLLNAMWRNSCINDTYEPGSAFKIITMAAALEAEAVTLEDQFFCPGYKIVEDRRIRCHKVSGHGSENFVQGAMNSCNPVFMEVGLRLGVDRYYHYFAQFGLLKKTGIDLPGEAGTIMHKKEDMGEVELATVSFGQSFQITPIQMLTTAASLINGGIRVTPHLAVRMVNAESRTLKVFTYPEERDIISQETVDNLRFILEKVVSEGTGKRAFLEGFHVGGKTATSEKLPRGSQRYISSFIGFAPAEDPELIGLITIDEPQGIYYGGTIAAPVMASIFANALPYMGIEKTAEETAAVPEN